MPTQRRQGIAGRECLHRSTISEIVSGGYEASLFLLFVPRGRSERFTPAIVAIHAGGRPRRFPPLASRSKSAIAWLTVSRSVRSSSSTVLTSIRTVYQ